MLCKDTYYIHKTEIGSMEALASRTCLTKKEYAIQQSRTKRSPEDYRFIRHPIQQCL